MGEVSTTTTRLLGLGDDFIYQMIAFRSMRVFRIVKLTKHLTGLRKLTARAFGTPAGVMYAMAVTLVFIVFCALFGNQLFSNSIEFAMKRNDFQVRFFGVRAMLRNDFRTCVLLCVRGEEE